MKELYGPLFRYFPMWIINDIHRATYTVEKKGWRFMDNDMTALMTVEEVCEALTIGKNAAYRLLVGRG